MLATLDPNGLPLLGATLPGQGTDESHYLPTWKHLAEIIGHKNFLFLADCKASSWANRAMIDQLGGIYCFPVAMTPPRPKLLSDWITNPPTEVRQIFAPDAEETDPPLGRGFEIPLGSLWFDPDKQEWHRWSERWLAVCSYALRDRQLKGLSQRLVKAEQVLKKLADRPGKDAVVLEKKVTEIRKRYRVTDYFLWEISSKIHYSKVYEESGRLPALPIYFQDEQKIRGLMFLLTIALQVFTLMEFVVRRQLVEQKQLLAGLYDGNPKRTTERPTAERLLAAFSGITLYFYRDGSTEITGLNPLQKRILALMKVPESIYILPSLVPG